MSQKKINVKERLNSDGEIDLSMLEIQDVPIKEIVALKKATTLNLYNNNISTLPKTFSSLTNIVKLDLSKNCITELPENFGDLVKLKHLDLYQNQLSHLPVSFSKLKALKWLDLKENPLEATLKKVAGPCENTKQCQTCARNIVAYLSRQQNRLDAEREEKEKSKKQQLELKDAKKKDEKKSKKKEQVIVDNGTHTLTKTEKKKLKKLKKLEEVNATKSSNGLWWIFLFLFAAFIITSIKLKSLQYLDNVVFEYYRKLELALPESYRKYAIIFRDNFKLVHGKVGEIVLNAISFVQTNEQCLLVYDICRQTVTNVTNKVHTLYKNFVP